MFRGGKVPGYNPPISLALAEFQNGVEEQLGNGVMEYLYSIDIHVDKEELIKALQYDRGQYEKGYKDGCRDSLKVGEWTTIEDDILMETIYQCSLELMGDWSGQYSKENFLNGKIMGEFICDKIRAEQEITDQLVDVGLVLQSCLSSAELLKYANGKALYSWHISELKIYDEPKPLNKFVMANTQHYCHLQRPPQSWCYVEEV